MRTEIARTWRDRGLALLLLLAVVGLPVLSLVAGYRHLEARHASLVAHAHRLGRAIERELRLGGHAGRMPPAASLFVSAPDSALAAAVVQNRLKALARRYGLRLASNAPAPGGQEAGYEKIRVQARLQGPYAAAVRLLHALEQGRPVLFIERLTLYSRAGTARRGTGGDAVDLSLVVSGFRLPAAPGSGG